MKRALLKKTLEYEAAILSRIEKRYWKQFSKFNYFILIHVYKNLLSILSTHLSHQNLASSYKLTYLVKFHSKLYKFFQTDNGQYNENTNWKYAQSEV